MSWLIKNNCEDYKEWSEKNNNLKQEMEMYIKMKKKKMDIVKKDEEKKQKEEENQKKERQIHEKINSMEQKTNQLYNQLYNSSIEKDLLVTDREKHKKKISELNNQIMDLKTGIIFTLN